jgi:molecular chaperone GrpE
MPSSPGSDEQDRPDDQAQQQHQHAAATEVADPAAAVAELQQQNQQLEERYRRALADLENFRKRSARDADRRITDNRDALIRDWLDAVDAVERALRMQPENPAAEGLRAVLEQMEAILARQGIRRIGAGGEPFDPERHEAVSVTESGDLPDRTIVEVARSGFAAGDRVVRPAQVVVSRRDGREA